FQVEDKRQAGFLSSTWNGWNLELGTTNPSLPFDGRFHDLLVPRQHSPVRGPGEQLPVRAVRQRGHRAGWATELLAQLPGRRVPELDGAGRGSDRNRLAVRSERHHIGVEPVGRRGIEFLPAGDVPELHLVLDSQAARFAADRASARNVA